MKNNLRLLSIFFFAIAIPGLIMVDWYYKENGIFVMFLFITIGLVLDQIIRLYYPDTVVTPEENYRCNKILNIFTIILFVQSPMAMIYVDRICGRYGFAAMAVMVVIGIMCNQTATIKFSYSKE